MKSTTAFVLLGLTAGLALAHAPNSMAQRAVSHHSSAIIPERQSGATPDKVAANTEILSFVVLRARALTAFDPKVPFRPSHRADFQVTTSIGDTVESSITIVNHDRPHLNHRVAIPLTSNRRVAISLLLEDRDPDQPQTDIADISPTDDRQLHLEYDPKTGQIFGPTGNLLGLRGEPITVTGNANQHRASITFIVK
ncbi:hypothetical protein IQ266_04475 [filamentous cyanobacterium LEGE 11480]|uniref:Uncharacterized protein n=1 Tax=Romeriopsis navalis LEGE 11480 TaxID=2777977 RepID=A0A928VMB9_9CYAN|nr:hypothetical protein [Romeriopsis navalis]MBE9029017.1 hypothetical protein [Romeriopsis navalis LEGE 11480]